MKVLLVSTKPKRLNGGIAVWTDRYMSRCREHGINCVIVNTEVVGKRAEKSTAKRSFSDEFVRTKRIFRDLKEKLASEGAIQVAHLNTSCGTFGLLRDYMIAKRIQKKGIPVITHYHCDIPYWIQNFISRYFLKKLASLSKKNLVLCRSSQNYLVENFGIEAVIIPNFIDETTIANQSKTITPTVKKVVFVGRVEEAKGVAEIYELAKRFPDICFELVGAVSETVAQWDTPENIVLLGGMPHETVLQKLDEADILLLPSHSEGFSVALLESMARGTPAIATDVGAAADMLADGCGIVVKKGDVDAMEQAIRNLADADARKAMSGSAMKRVEQSYTIDAVMDQFRKIYQSLW